MSQLDCINKFQIVDRGSKYLYIDSTIGIYTVLLTRET